HPNVNLGSPERSQPRGWEKILCLYQGGSRPPSQGDFDQSSYTSSPFQVYMNICRYHSHLCCSLFDQDSKIDACLLKFHKSYIEALRDDVREQLWTARFDGSDLKD